MPLAGHRPANIAALAAVPGAQAGLPRGKAGRFVPCPANALPACGWRPLRRTCLLPPLPAAPAACWSLRLPACRRCRSAPVCAAPAAGPGICPALAGRPAPSFFALYIALSERHEYPAKGRLPVPGGDGRRFPPVYQKENPIKRICKKCFPKTERSVCHGRSVCRPASGAGTGRSPPAGAPPGPGAVSGQPGLAGPARDRAGACRCLAPAAGRLAGGP